MWVVFWLIAVVFLVPVLQPVLLPIFWYCLKTGFLIFTFMWVRATLPRFRYDQLMGFCWKFLFPVALAIVGWKVFWGREIDYAKALPLLALSGAGPSILVFYERGSEAVCDLVGQIFRLHGHASEVLWTEIAEHGYECRAAQRFAQ